MILGKVKTAGRVNRLNVPIELKNSFKGADRSEVEAENEVIIMG
jgi:hypothetical protein